MTLRERFEEAVNQTNALEVQARRAHDAHQQSIGRAILLQELLEEEQARPKVDPEVTG